MFRELFNCALNFYHALHGAINFAFRIAQDALT